MSKNTLKLIADSKLNGLTYALPIPKVKNST